MKRASFVFGLGLGVVSSVATLAGCGVELRQQLNGVQRTIHDARANGAYRCAPRELALAETHAEFTDDELKYGNYVGAKDEIAIAAKNARLAFDNSPKERCAPQVAILDKPKDTDGDGVLDKDDRCPTVPGPVENQGCPWPDRDGDGVLDKDDRCPDVPGPVENQGCPWPDRDKDGVLDKDDRCPDVPGPVENQGCPVYKLITVTNEKIELKQKVHFATDKSRIFSDSFEMLNEVADVLGKNVKIEVRIEGHTDSRGSLKHNMKLSQDRADSVRNYLIQHDVPPSRMTAVGYGPTRPIDDNRTAQGRAANRRVEFIITNQ